MTQEIYVAQHSLHAIFNLFCFYGPEVTSPTQSIDWNTAINFTVTPVVSLSLSLSLSIYIYIYEVSTFHQIVNTF